MSIKLYNTLTGRGEEFIPFDEKKREVGMYVCGPTVFYEFCDIERARSYLVFDVIRRYLEYRGYKVKYVMNFTDIADGRYLAAEGHKTIYKAKKKLPEVARDFIRNFFIDMDALNIKRADAYPKTSEHIEEIKVFIKNLLEGQKPCLNCEGKGKASYFGREGLCKLCSGSGKIEVAQKVESSTISVMDHSHGIPSDEKVYDVVLDKEKFKSWSYSTFSDLFSEHPFWEREMPWSRNDEHLKLWVSSRKEGLLPHYNDNGYFQRDEFDQIEDTGDKLINIDKESLFPSSWGYGKPGWHIQCSAMSVKHLGNAFEIHGGLRGLMYSHHQFEKYISDLYSGKPVVKYWLHSGSITNAKMKHRPIRHLFHKYEPKVVRFSLISHHYGVPLNYSYELLNDAREKLERISGAVENIEFYVRKLEGGISLGELNEKEMKMVKKIENIKQEFIDAMDNNFNMKAASKKMLELTTIAEELIDEKPDLNVRIYKMILDTYKEFDIISGVLFD